MAFIPCALAKINNSSHIFFSKKKKNGKRRGRSRCKVLRGNNTALWGPAARGPLNWGPALGWGPGREDGGTSEGPSAPHPGPLRAARQSLGVRRPAKSLCQRATPPSPHSTGETETGEGGISAGPRAPPHGAGKLGSWPSALGPQGAGKAGGGTLSKGASREGAAGARGRGRGRGRGRQGCACAAHPAGRTRRCRRG